MSKVGDILSSVSPLYEVISDSGVFGKLIGVNPLAKKENVEETPSTMPRVARQGQQITYKKGGLVKSSASNRADGIAKRGKTKGRTI